YEPYFEAWQPSIWLHICEQASSVAVATAAKLARAIEGTEKRIVKTQWVKTLLNTDMDVLLHASCSESASFVSGDSPILTDFVFKRFSYLQAACGALPDSPEISARSQQTKLSESRAASTQSLRSTSGGSRRPASQQICASRLTPSPSSHSVYLRSLWVRDCAVNHTDMRKGLEVARDIVAKAPDNLDISPVYVDMLVKFGTTDATDEIFLYADNLLNEGKTSRRSADRPEPWYAAGMYHHAAALQAGGNFAQAHRESARRFLARALEVSPSFGPAWIALGRSFAANDESDRAIQAYRSATKHCPDWHVPWLLIGIEHLRVGSQDGNLNGKVDPQHATALTYLERARDMAPADPEVRNQIGIFHSKTGHHEQAIASFTEAVDMENSRKHSRALPHSKEIAKYHNNLAFSLCQSGRLEEATEACLRALKTVSNGNCSEAMEAHQLLAFVLSKRGYSAQAIDNYHQAIGIGDKAQGSVSTRAAHSLVNRLMRDLSQEGIPGCLPLEHLVRTVECQMKTDK
ncbi:Anaphase-promoting complex subunit, partial [Perkinsus chesapeaki]